MLLLNWLSTLRSPRVFSRFRRVRRAPSRRRRDRALRFSPWTEALEERLMLTVQTHFDPITEEGNPVFGNVDPESIDIELMPEEQSTHTVTLAFAPPTPQRTVDIVFVVDESGSMSGEQDWLTEMVEDLNDSLVADGITDNRFALVGYLDQGRIFGTESGTAPADLLVSFYAPDNTLVQTATVPVTSQSGLIKADFTLPQSGQYTVVVQNKSSSASHFNTLPLVV